MLYPTLNQPLILLIVFVCGLASGLFFDVSKILTTLSGNDKFSHHLFDFVATLLSFALLFFANMQINYGQFRIYIPLVFLVSFSLERFISKFLWTKLVKKWYSIITRRKPKDARKTKTSS